MPQVDAETIAIVLAACGLLVLVAALRRLFRRRFLAAVRSTFAGILLLAVAAVLFLIATNLHTYARLTHEEPVADIAFAQQGPQQFLTTLTRAPSGDVEMFLLDGDEWQLDARVLKWRGFANLLGLDARYRLERVSGRYRDIEQERSAPRTVYGLAVPPAIDLWAISRANPSWLPFVDALYGSATYLPMADGARYRVTISQSGLVARPTNDAAESATRGWH
jgi:hypothetical protein